MFGVVKQGFFSITDTIPEPIAAPVITHHTNSSTSKLFVVNTTDAMPTESSEENQQTLQNVSYLYKIQQGSDPSYIWQVILNNWCTLTYLHF